ncbi:MAG: GTP-binding protein [Persephonella sp.]|nr:MAG: GTP-binding protein [Persephonella sp.]
MTDEIKVIITGHFSAGKTQFIKTLTGNAVSTEVPLTDKGEAVEKDLTTVALDYGNIEIDGKKVHLFGTPGQERFDFMLDVLSKNFDAVIILLDSTNREGIEKTKKFIKYFINHKKPLVIACNKQDLDNKLSISEISEILNIPEKYLKPLVATDKNKTTSLVKEFVNFVEEKSRLNRV